MSKISLSPDANGTGIFTIASPNSNTNRTLTLPDDTGTIVTNSGNQAGSFTTLNTSGAVVFNDAGADVDFRVEGDTDANLLFVDASADKVGVGTNSPGAKLHVKTSAGYNLWFQTNGTTIRQLYLDDAASTNVSATYRATDFAWQKGDGVETARIDSSGNVLVGLTSGSYKFMVGDGTRNVTINPNSTLDAVFLGTTTNKPLIFGTNDLERARIDNSGNLLVGSTAAFSILSSTATGFNASQNGIGKFYVSANTPLYVGRQTDDGTLVDFRQAGTQEGSISVSGNTVSYNPFLGSHSGALADWSKPDIKIGTVMDTIDELLEYKVVVIDVQEEVPAKEAVLDEEGNEVEPAQEATTQTVQKRISYNGNGAVGSTATVEYEGQEYTGTIQHEREEPLSFNKHLKVKINDTAASKTVFGVFVGWNNDSTNDGGVYNDMLVGAVGNYVIRMAAGQTPEAGDLVEADGNGCAVVQDDDIIRTKTIAKVTSTIPQVTYDDGSFLVTCVLYCG